VSSAEASPATLARRSHKLASARDLISGGESSVQLKAELKILGREERNKLLESAQLPIVIPTNHSLAMKADLALPWAKLRIINR
jgi:hypothetical protein